MIYEEKKKRRSGVGYSFFEDFLFQGRLSFRGFVLVSEYIIWFGWWVFVLLAFRVSILLIDSFKNEF